MDNKEKEITKERKLLSPKIDIIFQTLFGEIGNERITKKFLEAILEREIKEIDLSRNIVLRRENLEDKMGVLDVLAKINDQEYCNIEMQMIERDKLIERIESLHGVHTIEAASELGIGTREYELITLD